MTTASTAPSLAHLTRQLDIIPPEVLGERINIVGVGAIGSWTALSLAKMGFANIHVWDHDTIEVENLSSQFFRHSDIGKPKAVALQSLVQDFANVQIAVNQKKFDAGQLPGIVISAVDSMAARRLVWDQHRGVAVNTKAIIDPRMGAETALMYVMNPMDAKDQQSYEASLYSDENAVQERCTAKATIYTANMLAGYVCKAVKDIVTGGNYPRSTMWSIKHDDFKAWHKDQPSEPQEEVKS